MVARRVYHKCANFASIKCKNIKICVLQKYVKEFQFHSFGLFGYVLRFWHIGASPQILRQFLASIIISLYGEKIKWYKADAGYAEIPERKIVCTKMLYRYVDLGLLPIRNIDLLKKLRKNTKQIKIIENKRILG